MINIASEPNFMQVQSITILMCQLYVAWQGPTPSSCNSYIIISHFYANTT